MICEYYYNSIRESFTTKYARCFVAIPPAFFVRSPRLRTPDTGVGYHPRDSCVSRGALLRPPDSRTHTVVLRTVTQSSRKSIEPRPGLTTKLVITMYENWSKSKQKNYTGYVYYILTPQCNVSEVEEYQRTKNNEARSYRVRMSKQQKDMTEDAENVR